MKIILVLATLVLGSFGCQEIFKNKTVFEYSHSYGYARFQTEIDNVTIICSNIYSIEEIYYSYSDQLYEQYLKITNSNVSTLFANDFAQFDTIAKLFLSGIKVKEIKENALSGLEELEELYLDKNELSVIPEGAFTSLTKLKVLDLSENKLVTIEKSALSGLHFLWKLDLHSNRLSKLEDDTFADLSRLYYLDLSENPLETMPTKRLPLLDYLGLAQTSVKKVDQNLTVVILDLSRNNWTTVDFSTLSRSATYNLSNNALTSLKKSDNLKYSRLLLRNNRFKSINESLKELGQLDLAYNLIEKIDSTPFQQSKSIILINLSFNKISFIAADTFQGLSSLSRLYLQNNNISILEPGLFKDLKMLALLDLSHNNIGNLQYGIFNNLKNLRALDLSFNKLKKLSSSVFYSITGLNFLDLSYNNISKFDAQDVSGHLPSLLYISLDGNNWKCEQLIELDRKMRANITSGESYDVENFNGIACRSGNHIRQNSSDFSAKEILQQLDASIDETIRESKLEKFLNEDFEQSNFAKFFKRKYNENEVENKSVSEPASAPLTEEEKSDEGSDTVAILSLLLQLVMCVVLVAMAFFMYKFFSSNNRNDRIQSISQVELNADY